MLTYRAPRRKEIPIRRNSVYSLRTRRTLCWPTMQCNPDGNRTHNKLARRILVTMRSWMRAYQEITTQSFTNFLLKIRDRRTARVNVVALESEKGERESLIDRSASSPGTTRSAKTDAKTNDSFVYKKLVHVGYITPTAVTTGQAGLTCNKQRPVARGNLFFFFLVFHC